MRLAWLEPPSPAVQGDQIYRTVQPARGLAEAMGGFAVAGNWLQAPMHAAAQTADVLCLCQTVDIDLLGLLRQRRRAGGITLMELNDNFLEPRAFGEVGSFYHQPAQAALALQLAECADGLIVSTPYLAQLFGHLNPRLLVLPNAIETLRPLRPKAAASGRRLGWAGSAGHRPDLIAVMPALRHLMANHPSLTLCIMAPQPLHELFDWVPPGRLDVRGSADLNSYLDFIATWDVGIAPLTDTPFNRGRSDVKFLEYASMGVPLVASKGPAYHTIEDGKTGLLAATHEAFVQLVERLLADDALRATLRAQAWDYVAQQRTTQGTSEALQNFVSGALGGRPMADHSTSARWHARLIGSRHVGGSASMSYLGFDASEQHLFAGLRQQQDRVASARHIAAAQALEPTFYLPHLLRGALCPHPAEALEPLLVARRLAPHSTAAAYYLSHALMQVGRCQEALALATQSTAADGGAYAPLHELMAQLHRQVGDGEAERRALHRALEANRWYGPPALTLAAQAVSDAEAAKLTPQGSGHLEARLDAAYTALCKSSSGPLSTWQDLFWLARLQGMRGQWAAAQPHLDQALGLTRQRNDVRGEQMCLGWLAKAALALGDAKQARAYLLRSRALPRAPTAHNAIH